MSRVLPYVAGIGAIALITQMALFSFSNAGNASRMTAEDAAKIWGAGSDCVHTDLGTTYGCADSPCTPALNVKAEGAGSNKLNVVTCAHSGTTCGQLTVAAACG